jgi:hypothetical protein
MALLRNPDGINQPIFVDDYGYIDISAESFSPIETLHDWIYLAPVEMHASRQGMYMKKGFLARPDTTGAFYAITLRQYKRERNSFQDRAGNDIEPELFNATANTWIECPLVKVFSSVDSSYVTASGSINVGEIL